MCSDAMIMCMIMALLTWALSFNTFFVALKTTATNFTVIHNLILGVFWIFTINVCTFANIIYLVKDIKTQNFKTFKENFSSWTNIGKKLLFRSNWLNSNTRFLVWSISHYDKNVGQWLHDSRVNQLLPWHISIWLHSMWSWQCGMIVVMIYAKMNKKKKELYISWSKRQIWLDCNHVGHKYLIQL
jgi:hypothetical protein